MSPRTKSFLWTWLPLILWLVLIAIESTSVMSATNTGDILYRIVKALFASAGHHRVDIINHALRKLGHFTGYGILGLLFFRAIHRTLAERGESLVSSAQAARAAVFGISRSLLGRAAIFAVVCTAAVAALDEWHQTFLPSRTGAFRDVVLDTAGAVILLLLVVIRYSLITKASEAK